MFVHVWVALMCESEPPGGICLFVFSRFLVCFCFVLFVCLLFVVLV